MSANNSRFFFNTLKIFTPKASNATIFAADVNEATDEIEAIESVLGTGLRARSSVSWDATAVSYLNLTNRLNNMDAGIRSTSASIHPQYALASGTVLKPTDGTSVALSVVGDSANASSLVSVTAGDGSTVLTATQTDVTVGKNSTFTAPVTVSAGSLTGLTLNVATGYTGDVLRVVNNGTATFSVRADGTITANGAAISGGGTGSTLSATPTGTIVAFGGAIAPSGWLLCDGSAYIRRDYADLYSIIGNTYGPGDGANTFNVPNLQSKFPVGRSSSIALGATGGSFSTTIGLANLPTHTHTMDHTHTGTSGTESTTHSHQAFSGADSNNYWVQHVAKGAGFGINTTATGSGSYFTQIGSTSTSGTTTGTSNSSHTHTVSIGSPSVGATGAVGSNTALDTTPPYVAVNYIIKT